MKKFLLITIIFLGLLYAVDVRAGIIIRPVFHTGLVGYWDFQEGAGTTANDRSGYGNHGTISGPSWSDGKLGKALDFEKSESDSVTIPDSSSLENITDMTVSVWFKGESFSSDWDLLAGKGVGGYWWVGMHGDDFATGPPDITITADLSTNTWYHAVFVFDDTNNRSLIYKNGNVVDSRSWTSSIPDTTGDVFYIGLSQYGEYFDGLIDEVRVYNRALETSEITALYNSGLAKINASQNNQLTNGLVGLWSFNGPDMDGDTAIDRSGQGNNGTLYGPVRTIGKLGQALSFDGTDDYVDVNDNDIFSFSGDFSISLWAYFDQLSNPKGEQQTLIKKKNSTETPAYDEYCVVQTYYGSTENIIFQVYNSDGTTFAAGYEAGLSPSTWYHIVAVKNGTGLKVYVNNVNDGNDGTFSGSTWNSDATLRMGADEANSARIDGTIDEVRVYNRALSAQEIQRLYNMGR